MSKGNVDLAKEVSLRQRGRFITIEGIEGVGKTTNINSISYYLNAEKIKHILSREPGGTELAEQIRQLLLTPRQEKMSDMAELLLVFAARAQHLDTLVMPALEQGTWVVCDRFTDATYAYQGGGRGLDNKAIATLESLVQGKLRPDLTIILDIDPVLGLTRARQRGDPDRFEQEALEFFGRVRAVYLRRAEQDPSRYLIVDAGQTLKQVQAQIIAGLQKFCRRD
jgi:dTMP kinase